ncbi:MAG: hypothetical protein ABIG44_13835 [Planctomycetota bacterium]
MEIRKWITLGIVCVLALTFATGCPFNSLDSRTNNQGGGSILTAGIKFANNTLSALTADEIQIITDLIIQQAQLPIDSLTDEQAAAIVIFIHDNNLNTIEDFLALRNANINDLVISDEVREVLESDELLEIIATLSGFDFSGLDLEGILGG